MFKKDKPYTKIKGMGRTMAGYTQLWMGKDHLLSVKIYYTTEKYKRFFYKDIQAFIIQPTKSGVLQIVLSLLVVLGMALGIFAAELYGLLVILFPFLLYAFYLIYQQGTCKCWVQTATRRERLPSLSLRRKTTKAIAKLQPVIEAAQGGGLTPESLDSIVSRTPTGFSASPQNPSTNNTTNAQHWNKGQNIQPRISSVGQAQKPSRQFHGPLFLLVMALAVFSVLEFALSGVILTFLQTILTFGLWVVLVITLVRQAGSGVSSLLKSITWITGVFSIIMSIMAYILYMSVVMDNPEIANNHWLLLKSMAEIQPQESDLLYGMTMVQAVGNGILGILGGLLAITQKSGQTRSRGMAS